MGERVELLRAVEREAANGAEVLVEDEAGRSGVGSGGFGHVVAFRGRTSASTATQPFGPQMSGFASRASRSVAEVLGQDREADQRPGDGRQVGGGGPPHAVQQGPHGQAVEHRRGARLVDRGQREPAIAGASISTPPAATMTSGPNWASRTTPRPSSTPGWAMAETDHLRPEPAGEVVVGRGQLLRAGQVQRDPPTSDLWGCPARWSSGPPASRVARPRRASSSEAAGWSGPWAAP